MPQKKQLTLNQLETGQTGVVVQVFGGRGIIRRLDALGIRPGKKVTKVSTMLFRGPVSLRIDGTQVAIGFGMARKILIEIDESA